MKLQNLAAEILYFKNDTCVVCDTLLEKLLILKELSFPELEFNVVNAQHDLRRCAEHNVFTTPLAIIFIDNKEYMRFSGYVSVDEIQEKLQRLFLLSA